MSRHPPPCVYEQPAPTPQGLYQSLFVSLQIDRPLNLPSNKLVLLSHFTFPTAASVLFPPLPALLNDTDRVALGVSPKSISSMPSSTESASRRLAHAEITDSVSRSLALDSFGLPAFGLWILALGFLRGLEGGDSSVSDGMRRGMAQASTVDGALFEGLAVVF